MQRVRAIRVTVLRLSEALAPTTSAALRHRFYLQLFTRRTEEAALARIRNADAIADSQGVFSALRSPGMYLLIAYTPATERVSGLWVTPVRIKGATRAVLGTPLCTSTDSTAPSDAMAGWSFAFYIRLDHHDHEEVGGSEILRL